MCKEHDPLKWRSKFFKFYVRIYLYWGHRPWPRCNNRELNNKCLLFITLSTWYFLLAAWNPKQYIEIWNILNAKKDRYDVRFITKVTISHFLQISTNCPWYELVEWPNTSETSKLLRSCRGQSERRTTIGFEIKINYFPSGSEMVVPTTVLPSQKLESCSRIRKRQIGWEQEAGKRSLAFDFHAIFDRGKRSTRIRFGKWL